jgi:hypothetical protein
MVVICVMMRMVRGGVWSGVVAAWAYDFNSRLSSAGADGNDSDDDESGDVGVGVGDGDDEGDDVGVGVGDVYVDTTSVS